MGNQNCCCRGSAPKCVEGSTQTTTSFPYNIIESTTISEQNLSLVEKQIILEGGTDKASNHRRIKSEVPSNYTTGSSETSLVQNTSIVKASKCIQSDSKPNHQKNNSMSTTEESCRTQEKTKKKIAFQNVDDDDAKRRLEYDVECNAGTTQSQTKKEREETTKKAIHFAGDQNVESKVHFSETNNESNTNKKNNNKKACFASNEDEDSSKNGVERGEEEKNMVENDEKSKKKGMFAEEKKVAFQDNTNEVERGRSKTNNLNKQNIPYSMDLSQVKPRSKSCDTGKLEMESENKEIDEMFEALANFHALRLNKKNSSKNSINLNQNDLSPEINQEDDFDDSSSDSSNTENGDKDEMDLAEIVDVEKFISRRLSKNPQETEEDLKKLYQLSPKMRKLLGKFYNDGENNNDFSDAVEHNKLHLEHVESSDSKKEKTSAKNNNATKKQMLRPGKNKPEPKMVRRNSEKDFAKIEEENNKLKKLLQELNLFNRYGSNFTVKVSNNRPLIKTGGGFITLEDYLDRVLNKLAKKSKKNKQIPKIQLDPSLIQKLSEYLVSMAVKNEIVAQNSGSSSKFVTARVQRRPTGWMVKNKKNQQEVKKSKDLQIDEKTSVQLVSPNRNFKF